MMDSVKQQPTIAAIVGFLAAGLLTILACPLPLAGLLTGYFLHKTFEIKQSVFRLLRRASKTISFKSRFRPGMADKPPAQ